MKRICALVIAFLMALEPMSVCAAEPVPTVPAESTAAAEPTVETTAATTAAATEPAGSNPTETTAETTVPATTAPALSQSELVSVSLEKAQLKLPGSIVVTAEIDNPENTALCKVLFTAEDGTELKGNLLLKKDVFEGKLTPVSAGIYVLTEVTLETVDGKKLTYGEEKDQLPMPEEMEIPQLTVSEKPQETLENAVPETTVPETTVPETTVPETTVPETTVPETTVPETTVPETTEPLPQNNNKTQSAGSNEIGAALLEKATISEDPDVAGGAVITVHISSDVDTAAQNTIMIYSHMTEAEPVLMGTLPLTPGGENTLEAKFTANDIGTQTGIFNGDQLFLGYVNLYDTNGSLTRYHAYRISEGDDTLPYESQVAFGSWNGQLDVEGPKLLSLSADVTEVSCPGSITFTAEVVDEVSGVMDGSIQLTFDKVVNGEPNENPEFILEMEKQGDTNIYQATLNFKEYDPDGVYSLYCIGTSDNVNNWNSYYRDGFNVLPQKVEFSVTNPHPEKVDKEAPKLNSVSVNKTQLTMPGSVTLSLDITDDASGIDYVSLEVNKKYHATGKVVREGIEWNGTFGNPYTTTFEFTQFSMGYEMTISSIAIYDKAGHQSIYVAEPVAENGELPLPNQCKFSAVNPDPSKEDETNPVLKGISVDQKVIQAPGKISFALDIEETGSGFKHGNIDFETADGEYTDLDADIRFNTLTQKYEASLDFGEYAEPGTFYVRTVYIEDKAGNSGFYHRINPEYPNDPNQLSSDVSFTVENDTPDLKDPVLKSITVTPDTLSVPGELVFSAEAEDDMSGIESIDVNFKIINKNNQEESMNLPLKPTQDQNRYEGRIRLNQYTVSGEGYVYGVRMYDKAEHYVHYVRTPDEHSPYDRPLPNDCTFKIVNPDPNMEDSEDPKLISIRMENETVNAPGTGKVICKITDDATGARNVKVNIARTEDPGTEVFHVNLSQVRDTDLFEGTFSVSQYESSGDFFVPSMSMTDGADHYVTYTSSRNPDGWGETLPQEVNFKIVNSDPSMQDKDAPVLNSITAKEPKIQVPGSLVIELDITDDASGFKNGSVKLVAAQDNPYETLVATAIRKDPDTGKYVAVFNFDKYKPGFEAYVSVVELTDKAGHHITYRCGRMGWDPVLPNELDVQVINPIPENEDRGAPVVKSLASDVDTVNVPGSFKVLADLEDDASGIAWAHVTLRNTARPNKEVVFVMQQNLETGLYETEMELSKFEPEGEYQVVRLEVNDNVGHYASYYAEPAPDSNQRPLPNQIAVKVVNSNPGNADKKGPELLSIAADCKEFTIPGSFKLIAELKDDASGVKTVTANLSSTSSYGWEETHTITLYLNPETGMYEGIFQRTTYEEPSWITLTELYAEDNAGNAAFYSSDPNTDTGEILLPNEVKVNAIASKDAALDEYAPELVSVTVDKTKVKAPGRVKVTVKATDDQSGVVECNVMFSDPKNLNYNEKKFIMLSKNPDTGIFEGYLEINEYEHDCTYELEYVFISDGTGLGKQYTNDGSGHSDVLPEPISIQVIGTMALDEEPPVLQYVKTNVNAVETPGEFDISAKAADKISGVKMVNTEWDIYTVDGRTMGYYVNLTHNESSDLFEGKIIAPAGVNWKEFHLKQVELIDHAGNSVRYGTRNLMLPNDVSVKITHKAQNPVDVAAPEIVDISIDKTLVNAPGEVTITVTPKEEGSGISYISGYVERIEGMTAYYGQNLDFKKDESTGLYKATVKIGRDFLPMDMHLASIAIADNAGNSNFYGESYIGAGLPLVRDIRFTIVNPNVVRKDGSAPALLSVKAEKNTVAAPGTLKLLAEYAPDESGILSVTARLSNIAATYPGNSSFEIDLTYNPRSKMFEGTLPLTAENIGMKLELNSMDAVDNAGNQSNYISADNSISPNYGFCFDDVIVNVVKEEEVRKLPIYRMYNPYSYEHLLCNDKNESDSLVSIGWSLDGIAWYSVTEGTTVFRLYNPYDGSHLYTMDPNEITNCYNRGWQIDGPVSFSATAEDGIPIYRLYNPYASAHNHLYTIDQTEINTLTSLGWQLEGIAWYAAK